jgi:SAM-dependent methyltransferase
MSRPCRPRGGSHDFSSHPSREAELERLRQQALAAWPLEREWLGRLGLRDGVRLLDVGCGPGFLTRQLATLNRGGETVGLEPDPALADIARSEFSGQDGLTLHAGSIEDNSLPSGHFDLAYARFVFQHLPAPLAALRALLRLLKPGARIIIADADDRLLVFQPAPAELPEVLRRLAARQARAGGDRCVGLKLPALLEEAGFADVGFEVLPFTSAGLGRAALLDLAVCSRLLRIGKDEDRDTVALARRMLASFEGTRWHGVSCVVAAHGTRTRD